LLQPNTLPGQQKAFTSF